jgi:NAD(P)-dependent dehydrogenase (short-subunit alcohol dehydrogenase family)
VKPMDDRDSIPQRMRLDGKVALVTGASRDIGSAVAAGLASAGAEVALSASTADELSHVAADLRSQGVRVHPIACDIADGDTHPVAVSSVIDALGQIDILVHTAGGCPFNRPYIRTGHDGLGEAAEQSLRGVARVCEQTSRYMAQRKTGSVIIINAPETLRPWPELTARAMKSAQLELMKLLAREWAVDGVRINAISPGRIGLSRTPPAAAEKPDSGSAKALMGGQSPLDGVTAAVVWLASDAARHVTGAHIPLDGAGNITVTEEWRHLFEDLLAEQGDTSSRRSRPHLTAVNGQRAADINRRDPGIGSTS